MNLDELRLIIASMRERELREMKFAASLKGIDLSKYSTEDAEERVRKIKDRVAAEGRGENPEAAEWRDDFLTDYEVEE